MSLFLARVSLTKRRSQRERPQAEPRTQDINRPTSHTARYPHLPPRHLRVSRIPARLYMPAPASFAG
ncbi:hypothetical protein JB92DRAFT_2841829 [Gautieria morchelliformis]|nr:hypothetical protein JB92DRAFT_2841829 [Gautieria morchelliformis]